MKHQYRILGWEFNKSTHGAPRPKAREEVWCIKCKGQGHDKDHCPVFTNYLQGGGMMSLRLEVQVGPSMAPTL